MPTALIVEQFRALDRRWSRMITQLVGEKCLSSIFCAFITCLAEVFTVPSNDQAPSPWIVHGCRFSSDMLNCLPSSAVPISNKHDECNHSSRLVKVNALP